MPGKTDTWMPLYVADYLADTMHLTTRQHGAYLLLLMHAWRNGGSVPADHEEQAAVARLSPKDWEKDGAVIRRLFKEDDNGPYSKRAREELGIATANQRQRSEAGIASAAKRQRKAHENSTSGQRDPKRKPNPSPSPSPSPDLTTTLTVADNARERASHRAPRAKLISEDWEPDEQALAAFKQERPDIDAPTYVARMADFRDWCRSNAVTSHDATATWRSFMRKTRGSNKAGNSDAEIEAALERSKLWGTPQYKFGG